MLRHLVNSLTHFQVLSLSLALPRLHLAAAAAHFCTHHAHTLLYLSILSVNIFLVVAVVPLTPGATRTRGARRRRGRRRRGRPAARTGARRGPENRRATPRPPRRRRRPDPRDGVCLSIFLSSLLRRTRDELPRPCLGVRRRRCFNFNDRVGRVCCRAAACACRPRGSVCCRAAACACRPREGRE